MLREINCTTEIDAPAETVWHELTDTGEYGDWNPFVRRAEGELSEGETLEIEIAPPGSRPVTLKPKVLEVEPRRRLRWLGHLLVPGLFDGEHSFELEPLASGGTRFTQSERFTGILVRPFGRMLAKTELGFEAMNEALKARAEASA